MTVETRCPSCRWWPRAAAPVAGKRLPCPRCGEPFVVAGFVLEPGGEPDTAEADLPDDIWAALPTLTAPPPA